MINFDTIGGLKNVMIKFDNPAEANEIAQKLNRMGGEVYKLESVLLDAKPYRYYVNSGGRFCMATMSHLIEDKKVITYSDFMGDDKIKFKQIINPEDDPFGEENYGYAKESLENNKFEVGDRVRHTRRPGFGVGEVMSIISNVVYIKFQNKTGEENYDGHGWSTRTSHIYLYEFIGNSQRIIDFENDPYGEDS